MVISRNSKKKLFHTDECPYARRMSEKYRKFVTVNQARSKGYKECSWCGKTHGLYIRLRDHPNAFPHELLKLRVSYDNKNDGICFRTDIGFWKIVWDHDERGYRLYHLSGNGFTKDKKDKDLMQKHFHRQKDVDTTRRIGRIISYIVAHDKAKKIIKDDWKKLPKRTQQQKDYYNKQKKKERRKSIKRVNAIFKQLERERIMKNG